MYEKLKALSDARAEYIELFKNVLETLLINHLVEDTTITNVQVDLEVYGRKSKELYDKIEKLKIEAEIESEDNSIRILYEVGLIKKVNIFTRNNLALVILKELMFRYIENGDKTILTKEDYKKIIKAVHFLERTEKKKHRTEPQIGL